MKPTRLQSSLAIAAVTAAVLVGQSAGAKRPSNTPHHSTSDAPRSSTPDIMRTDTELDAKVVQYGDRDIVRVKTKLRYTTLIVLPKEEQILDFTCGDKEYWVVNGTQNFAYIKPAKASAETNLNLVTASGNVYSFVLEEVSATPDRAPDLKVFVELKDGSMIAATSGRPRFVSVDVADSYRQQVEGAREETRQVKQTTQAAIDNGVSRFISNVRFSYRFEAGKRPFFIRAMYHDDRFTYIQARPEETPTLYEFQDGTPNLINFKYENGAYVVDKILNRGYLAIGKQKLGFTREE
jgi:type IV secretory pathway VirB9-like protein